MADRIRVRAPARRATSSDSSALSLRTNLDEIPGAYKDIDAVMENQKDLVEIVHSLRQVVCVKG